MNMVSLSFGFLLAAHSELSPSLNLYPTMYAKYVTGPFRARPIVIDIAVCIMASSERSFYIWATRPVPYDFVSRPYACEVPGCGKRFAQYTALKTHRNVQYASLQPDFSYIHLRRLCPVRARNRSSAASLGASPHLVILRLALAIAGKSIILGNLSSVLFRVVHRGKSYLVFQVLDAYSWFYRILRSSSFKVHLKKHGLDPSEYPGLSKRDQSPILVDLWQPTEPEEIKEGQVSSIGGSSYNEVVPFPGPPDSWDPFFSLPMDAGEFITSLSLEQVMTSFLLFQWIL